MRAELIVPGIVVLALGCVEETFLIGGSESVEACLRAPTIEAPLAPGSCVSLLVSGSSSVACTRSLGDGREQPMTGQWVRISRPSREWRATISVRVNDGACVDTSCSEAILTRDAALPCGCNGEPTQRLGRVEVGGAAVPLFMQQQELLVSGSGLFEVTVCTDEIDPWPSCSGASCEGESLSVFGADGNHESGCQCLLPCDTDADCLPRRGVAATPRCSLFGCVLDCSTNADCGPGGACQFSDMFGGVSGCIQSNPF